MIPGPAGEIEVLFEPGPAAEPGRTAVVCHPHPKGGGALENKVVYTAARALRREGYHSLRFNFRGTGKSTGTHDGQGAEAEDVRAVLELARDYAGDFSLVLAGYSFGAWMGLPVGGVDEKVDRLIGIGLALGLRDFTFPEESARKPLLVIQGRQDEFAEPALVEAWVKNRPGPSQVRWIETGHFFHGKLDEVDQAIRRFVSGAS